MAKKSAVKNDSSKKTLTKESTTKDAAKEKTAKKSTKKQVAKKSAVAPKSKNKATPKAIKTLLTKGNEVEFPAEQLFSFTLSKELKIGGY